jgi:hypothetical protein
MSKHKNTSYVIVAIQDSQGLRYIVEPSNRFDSFYATDKIEQATVFPIREANLAKVAEKVSGFLDARLHSTLRTPGNRFSLIQVSYRATNAQLRVTTS